MNPGTNHTSMSSTGKLGGTLCLIGLAWLFLVLVPSQAKGSGEGEVNVYPDKTATKNYSLPAQISWVRKLTSPVSYDDIYTVQQADWPNGGYISFNDCTINMEFTATCVDDHGKEYGVKLDSTPESVSPESSD